ncbi:MAG: DNA repair protein RecO [Anaerolineae bacterium]|nr:DNA repair protein RecO [Anaerolineae bacterium]
MSNAPRSLTVDAVVVRHSDWGEADRLLSLFTREAGKLRAIAKGARKLRSRKAGHLEPFTHVRIQLARGRDFWIVTQAETVDAYLAMREDLLRTAYAATVIELLDRFTYDEGENRALFALAVDALGRINSLPDPFIAVRYFEIRLLDETGYRPQLFQCVGCGSEIRAEDQFFDALQGGVVCPRCRERFPAARPVSKDTLRFLRHLQRSNFTEAQRANPNPAQRAELESLLRYNLTYLLERRLNSPEFLAEVRRDLAANE